MIASVSKEFRFEAAHHLPNHDGKCREPHGHSYRCVVTVTGEVISTVGHPKEGMVIDFADIKKVWEQFLKPKLDHRDLNTEFLFPTTAENLAAFIANVFDSNGIDVTKVALWETGTSCAVVTGPLHGDEETMMRALEVGP